MLLGWMVSLVLGSPEEHRLCPRITGHRMAVVRGLWFPATELGSLDVAHNSWAGPKKGDTAKMTLSMDTESYAMRFLRFWVTLWPYVRTNSVIAWVCLGIAGIAMFQWA